MKKVLIGSIFAFSSLLASDAVTIDSMFKNQKGLRSVTSLQTLSSGSANSYRSYPDLVSVSEGEAWTDVKTISLTQTFFYDFTESFDALISASGSMKRREYLDLTNGAGHSDKTEFDSLWVGGTYSFDTKGAFKPSLTYQTSVYQKDRYLGNTKNSSLSSHSLRLTLMNYSDPVISSLYIGTIINNSKTIAGYKIEDGNSFMFGFDMSVVLSPKISLDFGMEQRYQTESKVDGVADANARAISTLSIGATYSIASDLSISLSGSLGGSSESPDSMMGISVWQKF
jgi:hypothetical protein